METGQHPQCLSVSVVAETDLTLRVPGAARQLKGFCGKPLDGTPTELLRHNGSLSLLEGQQGLIIVSLEAVRKLHVPPPDPRLTASSALTNDIFL